MLKEVGVLANLVFCIRTQRGALTVFVLVLIIIEGEAAYIGTEVLPGKRQVGIEAHGIGNNAFFIVQIAIILIGVVRFPAIGDRDQIVIGIIEPHTQSIGQREVKQTLHLTGAKVSCLSG